MTRKYIYVLSELILGEDNLPKGWTPIKYCASGMAVWNYLTHNGNSCSKLSVKPTGEKDMVKIARLVESSDSTELKRHNESYDNPLIGCSSEEYDEFFIVHRHEIFEKWNTGLTNTINGYEFVDLGLPSGLLWATCNVGATSPEQAGLYFAWGENEGFTAEEIARGERKFNKTSYKAKKINADLTLEQDAVHTYMGGDWRMPTKEEWQELIDNCTSTWTIYYDGKDIAGRIFTGPNGNSVFFPASGGCDGSSIIGVGSQGYFWSASWISSDYAWYLYFTSRDVRVDDNYQCFGFPVRGVWG